MNDNATPTHVPPPPKRRLPILARHAVSLAIAFALAIPVSYFVGQRVHQHLQLIKLEQADRDAFEDGLGYVYRHAGTEAGVADHALQTLDAIEPSRASDLLATLATSYTRVNKPPPRTIHAAYRELAQRLPPKQAIGLYDALYQVPKMDTEALGDALLETIELPADDSALDIVALLEHRLLWSRSRVPTDSWLTWLTVLAASESELTQHQAARRLGELPELADEVRVRAALTRLAESKHDSVRAMVLQSAAGYAPIAEDPTGYEQVIFELGSDANKTIARRAWLIVGHLNPLSGFAVNWKDADPFVAEAMLWSAVKTNPGNPKPAWRAYDDAATRSLSLQALALLRDDESRHRFDALREPTPIEQINIDPDRLIEHLTGGAPTPDYMVNLAAVSLSQQKRRPGASAIHLLRMNHSEARLIGAFTAAICELRPKLVGGLTAHTLREHPDLTTEKLDAMSDAELSELGLNRVDALTALLDAAEAAPPSAGRQSEAKLLRLALWMRGDLGEDFTPEAEAMLFDDELPTSTVLMALLHMQRPIALEYLFGDLVQPRPDLGELFIGQRFWHVFRRFVDTADLPLWLWGDPEAQAFQIEAMRQWYAVNRWRIERGWWPEVVGD